jgi:hypothetical protein
MSLRFLLRSVVAVVAIRISNLDQLQWLQPIALKTLEMSKDSGKLMRSRLVMLVIEWHIDSDSKDDEFN